MCLEVKVKQNCFALTSLTSFTVFLNWLFNVTIKSQLLQDTFKLHGIKNFLTNIPQTLDAFVFFL